MGNQKLDRRLLEILKQYKKDHNKNFPAIAIGWDTKGFVFVYHEHWRYCFITRQAPKVYIGGRFDKPNDRPYYYFWLD